MNSLDIPFPDTEYQIMNQYRTFNLIYPHEHPLSLAVKVDTMIRALSFSDPEYTEFVQNTKKPQDMVPIRGKLFEITYIRECKLSGVTKLEWDLNYGPSSARSFIKSIKDFKEDDYVKILKLKPPTYSLKELNHKYIK